MEGVGVGGGGGKDLTEGFCITALGGLHVYLEGLIFGILRYSKTSMFVATHGDNQCINPWEGCSFINRVLVQE